jgi:hypothetical protein
MTQITVTGTTLEHFSSVHVGPVEVCDPQGKVLGRFEPALPAFRTDLKPRLSEEEVRRILAEPGETALAEIWKKLGKAS